MVKSPFHFFEIEVEVFPGNPRVMGKILMNCLFPFGAITVNPQSTIVNNSGFTGKEFDEETRLHYNYFRDYHPSIGRYVAPDLVGLKGGVNKVRPSYQQGKTQKKVNPWLCWEGDLKKREVRMPARKEYWSVLKKWVDTRKNSYEIRK